MNNLFYTKNNSSNFITLPDVSGHVWLVSIGDGEDYEIIGVYTNEHSANSVTVRCNGQVKKIKLNKYANGYLSWHVIMLETGEVVHIESTDILPVDSYFIASEQYWKKDVKHIVKNVAVRTFAKDEAHALEIANKARLRTIEENLWEKGFITLDE